MFINQPLYQSQVQRIQNRRMQIEKTTPPETPTLITITSILNNIPKNRYVLYYQIPIYAGMYKPIEEIKDVLLIDNKLKFKILDLEMVADKPIFKQACFESKGKGQSENVELMMKFTQGEIILKGSIINRSKQSGIVFSLSVSEISGYINFLKFREKYRTLQNITRKQAFKLDHRIKIIDGNSIFQFSLEQSDTSHYFFTNPKLTIQVEQIYSVEDWQTVQSIFEGTLDLTSADTCIRATISILQKIKIVLAVELIRNANLSVCEMAALRVFEATAGCGQICIGTDRVGEMAQVQPVLQDKFYDYEYGYINQNLKQQKNLTIYSQIDKITKSFPKYPHLKNSKLLELSGSKFLTFRISKNRTQKITIPFVYILSGFNIIETENITIKFYMEFSGEESMTYAQKPEDRRRMIEVKLSEMWNIGEMGRVYKNFDIKLISTSITYVIPFTSEEVEVKEFRKEQKQLQLKQQCSQMQVNKYFILSRAPRTDNKKLLLTKTESICPFYLFDLFCSASVSFQVVANSGEIVLQGTVQREKIVQLCESNQKDNRDVKLKAILSSSDSLSKVILVLECKEIKHHNQSLRTYYKLLYKLEYTDNIPSDGVQYDLQIRRLTDNKKQRAKVSPQIRDDGISSLHHVEDGFFESTADDMLLQLVLRKMYYDEETELFDNSEVINKKIIVNSMPGQALEKDCLFLIIKEEGYNSLQFDFYDDNVKKRLRLHLEVFMRKIPLLDINKGKYTIKIPQYLWQLNKTNSLTNQPTLQTNLSSRQRRGQKISIFPDSPQQYSLQQYNYKDSILLNINGQIGYDRIIDAIKVRCEVTKEQIGWIEDSQWYLAGISVGTAVFWFMIKWANDPNGDWDNEDKDDAKSDKSDRTAGKKGSERSYSQKIDPLAKTVKNMELLKLKQYRNNLIFQGRMLTTKFVKKQQTILNYTKKIAEFDEKISKQVAIQKQASQPGGADGKKKNSTNFKKMAQFYRSICQCGQKNPKYNGFCQNCLKRLKTRYEAYLKQYKQKSYEYERLYFNKFNIKQKYLTIKNKLKEYKQRLNSGKDINDDNINEIASQMQNSELKRKIEQANIQIFRLKEERQKLENSSQYRLNDLESRIKKEDDDIWRASTELQKLNNYLNELHMKIDKPKQD